METLVALAPILAVLYLLIGCLLQLIVSPPARALARLVLLMGWPFILGIEGTPAMIPFKKWAQGE